MRVSLFCSLCTSTSFMYILIRIGTRTSTTRMSSFGFFLCLICNDDAMILRWWRKYEHKHRKYAVWNYWLPFRQDLIVRNTAWMLRRPNVRIRTCMRWFARMWNLPTLLRIPNALRTISYIYWLNKEFCRRKSSSNLLYRFFAAPPPSP